MLLRFVYTGFKSSYLSLNKTSFDFLNTFWYHQCRMMVRKHSKISAPLHKLNVELEELTILGNRHLSLTHTVVVRM